jgi:hypothetical protein
VVFLEVHNGAATAVIEQNLVIELNDEFRIELTEDVICRLGDAAAGIREAIQTCNHREPGWYVSVQVNESEYGFASHSFILNRKRYD